ncbi:MAG: hypothetical protein AAF127_00385 [Pseudomonadota bacterium]
MLEFLAAAAIQLPQGNYSTARSLQRRLPEVSEAGDATVAEVRLFVGPDGRVKECTIERAIGSDTVAQDFCKAAVGVKMTPARDERSKKAFGLAFPVLSAFPNGKKALMGRLSEKLTENPLLADFRVILQAMPRTVRENPRVSLKVRVDETGSVVICQPSDEKRKSIAQMACDQSRAHSFEALKTQEGTPVSYLRRVSVEFVSEE